MKIDGIVAYWRLECWNNETWKGWKYREDGDHQTAHMEHYLAFIAKNAHELQPVLQDKINITRTFWLATHRDVRHLARVNVFLDWLNDTVQQHADIF